MANSPGVSRSEFEDMAQFLNHEGFTLSVTIESLTGSIKRIGIYALKLPHGKFPLVKRNMEVFFREAPSYDPEQFNAVAWSFGEGNSTYLKAERSYTGNLVQLTTDWKSALSS